MSVSSMSSTTLSKLSFLALATLTFVGWDLTEYNQINLFILIYAKDTMTPSKFFNYPFIFLLENINTP